MTLTPYDIDLDRNPANFQPLTPLSFLERSAAIFPDHTAINHGALRRSYAEFYARARRLASALARRGIQRGDTVSALLANTPAMLGTKSLRFQALHVCRKVHTVSASWASTVGRMMAAACSGGT